MEIKLGRGLKSEPNSRNRHLNDPCVEKSLEFASPSRKHHRPPPKHSPPAENIQQQLNTLKGELVEVSLRMQQYPTVENGQPVDQSGIRPLESERLRIIAQI